MEIYKASGDEAQATVFDSGVPVADQVESHVPGLVQENG